MKNIFVLSILLGCTACTTPPPQPPTHAPFSSAAVPIVTMQYEANVQQLSRNDVITAVLTCQSSGLRAEIVNGKRLINGYITSIPVDVICLPRLDPYKW
jgi:hypothetical protein